MLLTALKPMATSDIDWKTFAKMAKSLGRVGVEFRHDLTRPLFDAKDTARIKSVVQELGLRVLALTKVKACNDWSEQKGKRCRGANADRGLTGQVEPLRFEIRSLRSKAKTLTAIEAVESLDFFKIVHNTFHHALAGKLLILVSQNMRLVRDLVHGIIVVRRGQIVANLSKEDTDGQDVVAYILGIKTVPEFEGAA